MGHDLSSICVTGSQGYLGSYVVEKLLAAGYSVLPLVHSKKNDIEIACDLTSSENTQKVLKDKNIDVLIHCAAEVPKKWNEFDQAGRFINNLEMLRNLRFLKPRKLIYCSSISVYGDQTGILDEQSLTPAPNAYAKSKLECEKFIATEGYFKSFVSIRIPGLFGGNRNSGIVYNTIKALMDQRLPEMDHDIPAWNAMHVFDAIDLLIKAATSHLPSNTILHLGYGVPQGIFRLILEIQALLKANNIAAPTIKDCWQLLNINKQLQYLGFPAQSWYQRLYQEIERVKNNT